MSDERVSLIAQSHMPLHHANLNLPLPLSDVELVQLQLIARALSVLHQLYHAFDPQSSRLQALEPRYRFDDEQDLSSWLADAREDWAEVYQVFPPRELWEGWSLGKRRRRMEEFIGRLERAAPVSCSIPMSGSSGRASKQWVGLLTDECLLQRILDAGETHYT